MLLAQEEAGPARGRGGGGVAPEVAKLEFASPDAAADAVARYFNTAQLAALRKLGEVLMPPSGGFPGAIDAGTTEFLDFLIGVSPAARQKLYKNGLDALNAHAAERFKKPFGEIDAAQADEILRPLLVTWTFAPHPDPPTRFVSEVHSDIRTATMNSPEWSVAASTSARRGRGGAVGVYWRPIDPIS